MNDKEKELNNWLTKIADNGPHEEIIDHINKHATNHIKHEPFDDWIDSMMNMCTIYNIMHERKLESIKNRLNRLKIYQTKHNSKF